MSNRPILVTGATGAQGGAVVAAFGEAEIPLRALVRDPSSPAARALAERGVELVRGDFEDTASLEKAVSGAFGVFSVQLPPTPADPQREVRAGRRLVGAARAAGVELFVQTSVARADEHNDFAGWHEGRWWRDYWYAKAIVNAAVREAGFARWTILKPAFLMENFTPPKVQHMFPSLARGVLESAMAPESRLDLVSAADVGAFAAAAFRDPLRFDHLEMPLAAESLTMAEVAATISSVSGRPLTARHLSAPDAIAAGNHAGVVESQLWSSVEGYRVDLATARSYGVELQSFADWAQRHMSHLLCRNESTG